MKFRTEQATEAYREILAEIGRIVQALEAQARDLPVEGRVHVIIQGSKLQLDGMSTAILTAAQIDAMHAGLVVGAHAMLSKG